MRSLFFSAFVAYAATGCAAYHSVEVLHPADVMVPGHIQTVIVIDRSSPDNVGSTVLGALEGAITGEGIMADPEGRTAAINELAWALRESDRYEIVVPNVTPKEVDSGVFDKQMDWALAKRLCNKHKCDGIISLEAFDSDTDILNLNNGLPVRTSDAGVDVYGARRNTRVMTSWRFYDTTQKAILDEQRERTYTRSWDNEGPNLNDARGGLPMPNETVKALGKNAGAGYAGRISPTWTWESRTWYSKGSPDMRMAKRYVKAGDWEGAAEIWRRMAASPDLSKPRVTGKAKFNLALYNERKGNLRVALERAREAAVIVPTARARSYVAVLERRLRDQERLAQQMAEAEEGRKAAEAAAEAQRAKAAEKGSSGGSSKPSSGGSSKPSSSSGSGTPPVTKD